MTTESLRNCSCKDLAQMARSEGLAGWHSMRKDELVRALVKHAKQKNKAGRGRGPANGDRGLATERIAGVGRQIVAGAGAAAGTAGQVGRRQAAGGREWQVAGVEQDRLVVMVRDPYWLHAYWELAPRSVERAETALGQHWHTTRPVLRVYSIGHDGTAVLDREISIHGGVNHWYVDVQNPPRQFRMEIGYADGGRPVLLPGAQQHGDDAAGRHERRGGRELGRTSTRTPIGFSR